MITSQRTLLSVHFNPSYFTTRSTFVMQPGPSKSELNLKPYATHGGRTRCCGKARPRQFVIAFVNRVFAMPTRLLSVSKTV